MHSAESPVLSTHVQCNCYKSDRNLSLCPNAKNSTIGTKLGWEEETAHRKSFQNVPKGCFLSFQFGTNIDVKTPVQQFSIGVL